MNSGPPVKPTRLALAILILCLSSFLAHYSILNFIYSTHQDPLLLLDSSAENETTEPHAHEDDMQSSERMIPGMLVLNPTHQWESLLPTHIDHPEQITPPPKSN